MAGALSSVDCHKDTALSAGHLQMVVRASGWEEASRFDFDG